MSGINFLGSYSGIDMSAIEKMMAVEKRPLIRMSEQKNDYDDKKNAWRDVNTRLTNLENTLKSLGQESTYLAKKVTVADEKMISATASSSVLKGSYALEVNSLASHSRLSGGSIAAMEGKTSRESLGISGTIALQSGDGLAVEINVEDNYSLETIARTINKKSDVSGVEAAIINKKLVLQSVGYGEKDITIGSGLDAGGNIQDYGKDGAGAYQVTAGELADSLGFNGRQVGLGSRAEVVLNGETIQRDTNVLTDVVQGMTLRLKDTGTTTVSVEQDTEAAVEKVDKFVKQYNSTMNFLKEVSKAGTPGEKSTQGVLYGESSLVNLQNKLRRSFSSFIPNNASDINTMEELGVATKDRYGELEFDPEKLRNALSENSRDVMRFFKDDSGLRDTGFYVNMSADIGAYTDKEVGIIKSQQDSIEYAAKNLKTDIEAFQSRMEDRENYYVKMFSQLEATLYKMESQQSWLSNQVSALNANNNQKG